MTAANARLADQSASSQMLTLRQGVDLLGQGRLLEAEFSFTAVLAKNPASFEALQFLCVLRMQQGRLPEALDLINRALKQRRRSLEALALQGVLLSRLDRDEEALESYDRFLALSPDHVETLYNRGVALAKLGRPTEAIECYRKALAIRPGHGPALFNLANNLAKQQRHDEALASYDLLLASSPANADILNNRGNVLFSLERYEDALHDYDRGLAVNASQVDLLGNRAKTLKALRRHLDALACYDRLLTVAPGRVGAANDRGGVLLDLDRPDDALACAESVLAIEPGSVDALNNRCGALQRLGRFDEALAAANQALALDPNSAPAYFGRGNALQSLNRFEQAVECYQTSLVLGPGVPNVHKNLGVALHVLERPDEAIFNFEQALALGGKDDETRAAKSLVCLSLGRFAEGWQDYDGRLADPSIVKRDYPQPRWNGDHVAGTLLVWGEQGLGDQILHASMIAELGARAESLVVEVEPRMVDLFARSFPKARVVALGDELYAGQVDAHTPIGSLGRYLRPSWESFARPDDGFLVPDPKRAGELRARLADDGRTIVGLSWKSQNPKFEKAKTARLMDFEAVLRQPGCRFVDLQYGDTLAEREAIERELGVRVEHLDDIDNTKDIDGVSALMQACDLVVTVSNTPAHMAGAVGRPMWVFIPYGHARLWYWFKGRPRSPWYPAARVKHQVSGQSWAELIASHADEIAAFAKAP